MDPKIVSYECDKWLPKEPSVLITFDDGYKDNIEYAVPILEQFGVKAMFFVITNNMESHSEDCNNSDASHLFMNWRDLVEIENAGHVLGAHTLSHPKMHEISMQTSQWQMEESIKKVKEHCSNPENPIHFAYPYGFIPQQALDFPKGCLAYGTVKAPPNPWNEVPNNIRRTYVPTGQMNIWSAMAKSWREQWFELQ
ncbi:hypothetical protein BK131_19135 [Paenibacillus amylolyticus]|uniref:NodB homology domain-containing protein n=1 Tax=Paenibacillus amylolyticus TaxID=1451 RepID=A0A1R1BQG8_PAEAM|nr:polysaccharide deacetylase family protein [Paenibacillus amylolyticus]OMF12119.1 hypothetical protein BK131_19135 [Paenibacillus amylolyticus]